MARRERLTYDLGEQDRRPVPWGPLALLVVILVLAVALVGWVVAGSHRSAAPAVATTSDGPTVVAPAPATPSVTPNPSGSGPSSPGPSRSSSPTPSGADAAEDLVAPEGSRETAALFVRAWLDPNPATRRAGLTPVTAPGLAEQLMLTDPANIPRAAPRGAPVLNDASTYSAEFTQTLSTGQEIQVYVVADPTARYRWLTTSVDQA